MMEGSHMKPTTEINTTIDYRKIGVHLKEARKANSLSQAQVAASLRIASALMETSNAARNESI